MTKTSLTLPEKFDITGIEALKGRFVKALEKNAEVIEINAQNVTHMDSSAVQLLLSFQNAAIAEQKQVKVTKVSDDFNTASELLGVQNLVNVV